MARDYRTYFILTNLINQSNYCSLTFLGNIINAMKYFIGILIIVLCGFIPSLIPQNNMACTEMGCPCQNETRDCNSCSKEKLIYWIGLFKVVKLINYTEVIQCTKDQITKTTYQPSNQPVKYHYFIFGFELGIGNPNLPTSHNLN